MTFLPKTAELFSGFLGTTIAIVAMIGTGFLFVLGGSLA